MKLLIHQSILNSFSNVTLGVLTLSETSNINNNNEIDLLLKEEEIRIRSEFQKETFSEHPVFQSWRKTYAAFGVKPKEAKSSVENLYRIVLSGRDVRRISPLVDIYNYISLKHMVPMGSEDLDEIKGDIILTKAIENEPPVLLLGDDKPEPPVPGEVIYKDDVSAICRRWNWRESDRTKLTDKTTKCIIVIEGVDSVPSEAIEKALIDFETVALKFCGGRSKRWVLNSNNPSTDELFDQ